MYGALSVGCVLSLVVSVEDCVSEMEVVADDCWYERYQYWDELREPLVQMVLLPV